MVNLTNKEKEVFKQVCLELLNSPVPVSSKTIAKRLKLKYSSATIRNIFNSLERKGFVYKSHFSSGRLVTDFGWRFFVDEFVWPEQPWEKINKQRSNKKISVQKIIEDLALNSGNLAIIFDFLKRNLNFFYQAGISQLFANKHLEGEAKEVAKDLENLIYNFLDWAEQERIKEKRPNIFIGKECGLLKKGQISLLVDAVGEEERETYFLIIGPKIMPYKKNLVLLEEALMAFEKYGEK